MSKNNVDEILAGFFILILAIGAIFWRLWVITKVWAILAPSYGLTPTLPGLKAAWGIGILIAIISSDYTSMVGKKEDTNKDRMTKVFLNYSGPALGWLIAWFFFT